jgi:hypothetical protein
MQDWGTEQWLRAGLIWLGVFALGGGIIAQTSEGASWNGFMAGMWKGVEWFLIIVVVGAVLFFGWLGIMHLASSMNQS